MTNETEELKHKLAHLTAQVSAQTLALRMLIDKLNKDFPDKNIAQHFRELYAETIHHYYPEVTPETLQILENHMRFLGQGSILLPRTA